MLQLEIFNRNNGPKYTECKTEWNERFFPINIDRKAFLQCIKQAIPSLNTEP